MPKPSKQSVQAFVATQIENYSLPKEFWDRTMEDHEIEARLRKFGLDNFEVELVMLRYIDNMTMKDIIEAQGWVSVNSVAHHLRSALRKLRKAGFTLI